MELAFNPKFGNHAMGMSIETLDADYFRNQALVCYRLAEAAKAAKPLCSRLYALAKSYDEKAKAADSTSSLGKRPQA
jgi:hypothetical protein